MSARMLATLAVVAASVLGPVGALGAEPVSTTTTSAPAEPTTTGTPTTVTPTTVTPTTVTPTTDVTVGDGGAVIEAAATITNRFVPVTPTRIVDTRTGLGGWSGRLPADGDLPVQVAGSPAGVPNTATAVVLNVTATSSEGPGFLTVFPHGEARPETSSVNITSADETVANLVTVRMGSGAVRIYNQRPTHLVVDVAGYYVAATTATAGRFQTVRPTRLLDTRTSNTIRTGAIDTGRSIDLNIAALAALPTDATVVLTLTATEPAGGGYLSVTPRGTPLGGVSNLNVSRPGQTIANQVVVPLQNGIVTVFTAIRSHVLVDLNGWYTGAAGASSTEGLFVPVTPGRLLDTRDRNNSPRTGLKPGIDDTVDVTTGGRLGVPTSGVAAAVVNATATDTDAVGFFTLFGAGLGRPFASNLNANGAGETVPNHGVVPVTTAGISFYTSSGANLVLDVTGYFTGTTQAVPGYRPNSGGPPSTGPHTFLYRFTSGGYARWNPCQALTYRVNYSGAPAFARTEVARAVAKVEAATGIDLVDLGDTTAGNDRQPPAGTKAVISFVSPAEAPGISGVAGFGGGTYYPAWNGFDPYVATGFVHINETLSYSQGTGPTGLEGLLLHELGHMVGLDHVSTTAEVMYPTMHLLPSGGYGPGDREGLWNLGVAKGCLNTGASTLTLQSSSGGGPQPVEAFRARLAGDVTGSTTGAVDGPAPVSVVYCGIAPAAQL